MPSFISIRSFFASSVCAVVALLSSSSPLLKFNIAKLLWSRVQDEIILVCSQKVKNDITDLVTSSSRFSTGTNSILDANIYFVSVIPFSPAVVGVVRCDHSHHPVPLPLEKARHERSPNGTLNESISYQLPRICLREGLAWNLPVSTWSNFHLSLL